MRDFVGIDLGREPVPDGDDRMQVPSSAGRTWAGRGDAGDGELYAWREKGVRSPPERSSTRPSFLRRARPKIGNRSGDPEMRQTKKGNQWYFGMKVRTWVWDSRTKLIRTETVVTPANVADATVLPELLYGGRDQGLGRSGVSWAERGDSAMRAARARLHPATLSV